MDFLNRLHVIKQIQSLNQLDIGIVTKPNMLDFFLSFDL
jgi:hypothetical protein